MDTQANTLTVLDYCKAMQGREYVVDKTYQRSDQVWPAAAQSFLIETILLDFPIPKMSIHQKLDLRAREVIKHIVDGQQRSKAILDFYEGKLRLSRANISEEFQGKTFDGLDEDMQRQFLNYGLNFDVFVGAQEEDIREVFRRMNSFTVPLNHEEKRHSEFQGPFKWFMHELSRDLDGAFERVGVFTPKSLYRMQDSKLLTEIVKAMMDGITTTNANDLRRLYKRYDGKFEEKAEVDEAVRKALQTALSFDHVAGTALAKPYNIYSLVLACVQARTEWEVPGHWTAPDIQAFQKGDPDYNLSVLAEAIEQRTGYSESGRLDETEELARFVAATIKGTNVADQRGTRYAYFLAALG